MCFPGCKWRYQHHALCRLSTMKLFVLFFLLWVYRLRPSRRLLKLVCPTLKHRHSLAYLRVMYESRQKPPGDSMLATHTHTHTHTHIHTHTHTYIHTQGGNSILRWQRFLLHIWQTSAKKSVINALKSVSVCLCVCVCMRESLFLLHNHTDL